MHSSVSPPSIYEEGKKKNPKLSVAGVPWAWLGVGLIQEQVQWGPVKGGCLRVGKLHLAAKSLA